MKYDTHSTDAISTSISTALDLNADRLSTTKNHEEFISAIHDCSDIWKKVKTSAPLLKWNVSKRMLDFALSASIRAETGLNDRDVETLISISRSAAREIARSTASAREEIDSLATPLWREWMSRHYPTFAE